MVGAEHPPYVLSALRAHVRGGSGDAPRTPRCCGWHGFLSCATGCLSTRDDNGPFSLRRSGAPMGLVQQEEGGVGGWRCTG